MVFRGPAPRSQKTSQNDLPEPSGEGGERPKTTPRGARIAPGGLRKRTFGAKKKKKSAHDGAELRPAAPGGHLARQGPPRVAPEASREPFSTPRGLIFDPPPLDHFGGFWPTISHHSFDRIFEHSPTQRGTEKCVEPPPAKTRTQATQAHNDTTSAEHAPQEGRRNARSD